MNPATDRPFPRKRPVKWSFVRECLASRKERRAMRAAGYVEREILNPQVGANWGKRVIDAVPSSDGRSVFVKIVSEN